MRAILVGLVVALTATACGPRQVDVRTGQTTGEQVSLHVTNGLNQPVNVYVEYGGNNVFLGQVAGGSANHMPVPNVAPGTSVVLRARTQDGQSTHCANRCQPIVLSGMYSWQVP